MSALLFAPTSLTGLAELRLTPSTPPARVISGAPSTAEHVLHERDGVEVGVWEVAPGSFHSAKHGISELMYFLSGSGTITRADGESIEIAPDTFVSLPDGSEVVWEVTSRCRKVYVITETTASDH